MEFVDDGQRAHRGLDRSTLRHDLAEQLRAMTDDEFLVQLALIGDDGLPFDGHNGLDLDDEQWVATFPIVAAEMARRVRRRSRLPGRLRRRRRTTIRSSAWRSGTPTSRRRSSTTSRSRCCSTTSRMDDFETRADAAAASAALGALVATPGGVPQRAAGPGGRLPSWPVGRCSTRTSSPGSCRAGCTRPSIDDPAGSPTDTG